MGTSFAPPAPSAILPSAFTSTPKLKPTPTIDTKSSPLQIHVTDNDQKTYDWRATAEYHRPDLQLLHHFFEHARVWRTGHSLARTLLITLTLAMIITYFTTFNRYIYACMCASGGASVVGLVFLWTASIARNQQIIMLLEYSKTIDQKPRASVSSNSSNNDTPRPPTLVL